MPIEWPLRELVAADQDFLWEILYIALWDAPDEKRRPRSVLDLPAVHRLVENWGRPEDFGLVAVHPGTGELVGAVWSRLDRYDQMDDFGCPFPCLGIGIREEFHGQGAGKALLGGFIDALRGRIEGLRLGVNPKNVVARTLYLKFGFREYAIGRGGYPQMKLALR